MGVVLVTGYGFFFSGGGWNQASRFDLVRALVDQRSVRIDAYASNTGDKAHLDGHDYCDKAPGVSLAAVPVVVAVRAGLWVLRRPATSPSSLALQAYFATFFVAGLGAVVAALSIVALGRRLGATPGTAALAALAFGLGTPMWPYATLLWGHAPAAGCLTLALSLAAGCGDVEDRRHRWRRAILLGLSAGWAVAIEFPAAGAAVVICALAVWSAGKRGQAAGWLSAAGICAGGAVPAMLLLAYNRLAFGSAFKIGYQSVVGFDGMKDGLLGVTWPRLEVALALFVSPGKGLVWLAPIVLIAPIGFALLWRRRSQRPLLVAAAAVFVYYFLLNAAYHYWDGGYSYGPRILGAALPFFGICTLGALAGTRAIRIITVSLSIVSAAATLAGVAVYAMLPNNYAWPLLTVFLPNLRAGQLGLNSDVMFEAGTPTPSFNLGHLIGLRGVATLLPLVILWGLAVLVYLDRRGIVAKPGVDSGARGQNASQRISPKPAMRRASSMSKRHNEKSPSAK